MEKDPTESLDSSFIRCFDSTLDQHAAAQAIDSLNSSFRRAIEDEV